MVGADGSGNVDDHQAREPIGDHELVGTIRGDPEGLIKARGERSDLGKLSALAAEHHEASFAQNDRDKRLCGGDPLHEAIDLSARLDFHRITIDEVRRVDLRDPGASLAGALTREKENTVWGYDHVAQAPHTKRRS